MIYLEGTSAFEFWTSPARKLVDVGKLACVSELADCPRSLRASAAHTLENIPCRFSRVELAVPASSLRIQRSRFVYHVRSMGIPEHSFYRIAKHVCVASPALAIVQMSQRLSVAQLAQVVCEMQGSYLRMPGLGGGMIDQLPVLLAPAELDRMIAATRGMFKTVNLENALAFARPNSASPKETELLLLLNMGKRRGGADTAGWQMNPSLAVPAQYRGYLGKSAVRPDVYHAEARVDVEYVSREEHDNPHAEHADSKRTNTLRSMGVEVIPVHPEDISQAWRFEPIVRQVRTALGMSYRKTSSEGLAARDRLMAELRTLPPFGYR